MCNPLNGQLQDGTIRQDGIFEEFSDIPTRSITSAIVSMETDGLITIDRSRVSITESGINRLQSSIACHVDKFDSCGCGLAIGRQSPGQYTRLNP
jgi:predicted methyltransferase